MRMLLVPLDERPCNYLFPQYVARLGGAELTVPPRALMGRKKQPADVAALADWVEAGLEGADALLLCLDTLGLGGLVPSRLEVGISLRQAQEQLDRIRRWRRRRPDLAIIAHMAVQRTNDADDDGEERPYWAQYGRRICRYGVLADRRQLGLLTDDERSECQRLEQEIPAQVLADYTDGRVRNHTLNLAALELARDGSVDFLLLTQDDSSAWGWAAREQRALRTRYAEAPDLWGNSLVYPGADEVGCTMVARALASRAQRRVGFVAAFSGINGPHVVPRYEDRPQWEGIKAQVLAAGGRVAGRQGARAGADVRLLVNSPSTRQGEAAWQPDPQVDGPARNLPEFCEQVLDTEDGLITAVADLAYCNGADNQLAAAFHGRGVWPRVDVFSAWNTSGNAVGTAIAAAQAMAIGGTQGSRSAEEFLLLRVLDDWFFQANYRQELERAGGWEAAAGRLDAVAARFREAADTFLAAERRSPWRVAAITVDFPWQRLFEVALNIRLTP
jgi:hypothetical protein